MWRFALNWGLSPQWPGKHLPPVGAVVVQGDEELSEALAVKLEDLVHVGQGAPTGWQVVAVHADLERAKVDLTAPHIHGSGAVASGQVVLPPVGVARVQAQLKSKVLAAESKQSCLKKLKEAYCWTRADERSAQSREPV